MSLSTLNRAQRVVVAAISAVVLVGVSACAADKTPKPNNTTVVTVTKTRTADPNEGPTAERSEVVDLSIPTNVTNVQSSNQATVAVETPDQLVRCQFKPAADENGAFVDCDVVASNYVNEMKKKPGWCDSYATDSKVPGFTVSSGPAVSSCMDELFPMPPETVVILKDGRAARNGDIICKSPDNQSQMTCWNTTTENGFQISSRTYQTF